MSKHQDRLSRLAPYVKGADADLLAELSQYKSIREACKQGPSNYSRSTVLRALKRIEKDATSIGMDTMYPEADMVSDHPTFGHSYLQRHDPPLPDGRILTWTKTKAQDVELYECLKALGEGMQVAPAHKRKVPKALKKATTDEVMPILMLADAHLGLLASRDETGTEWHLDAAVDELKSAIDYLVSTTDPVKVACLANLGDLTHADGLRALTPRSGNLLDVSHRMFDVCRAAGDLLQYAIEKLLEVAEEVRVFNVRGNHDEYTSWWLNERLQAYYRQEPRVVLVPNDQYLLHTVYGGNLVIFEHGDAGNFQQNYNNITDLYGTLFGEAQYVYNVQGHFHHERSKNIGKVFFETQSSLTMKDAYHVFKQYRSIRRMNMVLLDKEGGEHSRFTYNPRILT